MGTYARNLLAAMAATRPESRLRVFLPPGAVPLRQPGIEIDYIPQRRLVGRHFLWPRRLRRSGFDAYFGPAGLLPLRSVGAPAVITVHDLAIYRRPDWFPRGQAFSTRVLVPRSIRRAAAILAVSAHTARELDRLFAVDPRRIEVTYLGVSEPFRPLSAEELEPARARFGLPERFVLFVGTIEPRKNLLTLLEAWSGLASRPPLVLAGGWGWRFDEVRRRIDQLGADAVQLGPVEPADLPALYNLATCLAHPAWYEGFGLTPLEAMACGTPVVASNRTSLPEVVGQAALTVSPDDIEGWRRALERLLGDAELAARLRRRGLDRAARFTWSATAARTWEVIERVARPGAAG